MERKEMDLQEVRTGSTDVQLLFLADKLANMRSLACELAVVGETVWEKFHVPKEKQAWYYSKAIDILEDYQSYDETRDFYWELNNIYKDIFVNCLINKLKDTLYQV